MCENERETKEKKKEQRVGRERCVKEKEIEEEENGIKYSNFYL